MLSLVQDTATPCDTNKHANNCARSHPHIHLLQEKKRACLPEKRTQSLSRTGTDRCAKVNGVRACNSAKHGLAERLPHATPEATSNIDIKTLAYNRIHACWTTHLEPEQIDTVVREDQRQGLRPLNIVAFL